MYELEAARTFERIRKKMRRICESYLITFRANKKKDGGTIRQRGKLYMLGKLSIRKRLRRALISGSSRADPLGAYSYVIIANSARGLKRARPTARGLNSCSMGCKLVTCPLA